MRRVFSLLYSSVSRSVIIRYIDEVIDIVSDHTLAAVVMISSIGVLAVDTVGLVQAVIMSFTLMIISLVIIARVVLKSVGYGLKLLSMHQGMRPMRYFPFITYLIIYLYLVLYTLTIFYQVHLSILIGVLHGQRPSMQVISDISIPYTLLTLAPSVMPAAAIPISILLKRYSNTKHTASNEHVM